MVTDLTVGNRDVGIMITPEETLEIAGRAAKALQRVVSQKTKPVIINGEQYLEFEDLQLLGQFYGYAVKTGDAVEVVIDGVKGAKAHADLINFRTGEVIGGAEAYCMRDEEKWSTRPKYEWQGEGENAKRVKIGDEPVPWFQLASMAQTRAGAKACRNRLAWVAVLAGYRPTPAEEMTGHEAQPDKSEHYCHEHNAPFFKKGKMKAWAHPCGDTGEWCHEKSPFAAEKGKKAEPVKKEKATAEPTIENIKEEKTTEIFSEQADAGIPWESVKPGLTKLYKEKVGDWTTNGILTKLATLGADTSSGKIQTSYESLTPENKKLFAEMVAEADKAP